MLTGKNMRNRGLGKGELKVELITSEDEQAKTEKEQQSKLADIKITSHNSDKHAFSPIQIPAC